MSAQAHPASGPRSGHRASLASLGWQPSSLIGLPEDVARCFAREEGLAWLDSALPEPGSLSLLAANPTRLLKGHLDEDWQAVEEALAQGGGLMGWVGFEGEYCLGRYDWALAYEHDSGQWWQWGSAPETLPQAPTLGPKQPLNFELQTTRSAYLNAVRRALEYIAAGDIYQVNLSHHWRAAWPKGADFWPLYLALRQVSPAPQAAFLHLDACRVFCASPEQFLQMEGRHIVTRPIKGTRPRHPNDPAEDARSARELAHCEKERAELLMITDLLRNDLGQVCAFGSVHTPELWRVEAFAQVHHLVSTIEGRLRADLSHAAALKACLPGGSISGAPKRRALEIIQELEPQPRGLYTGAIGCLGLGGMSLWNLAIRTAVQRDDEIRIHAGSGIVADSQPLREWQETLHKASGLLSAFKRP